MTKFFKRCWLILAFLIITAAVISSLFRALTPWAKQYKTEVEQHLSRLLGETVTIDTMETGWYWFEPVIKLNQISIWDGKQEPVKLSKLLIGINVFSSICHWQIQPGVLLIEDLHLGIHQGKDSWQINGLGELKSLKFTWDLETFKPALIWIFTQQKIIIKNLSAQVYMLDGALIPLSELNLTIANRSGHYHIKGRGVLTQTTATNFQLLADLALNPYALNKATGQVFFSVQHLLPAQWQGFTPEGRFQLLGGKGNLQLWADIAKGHTRNIQARVNFHHLAWTDKQTEKTQLIQTIKANLAWKPNKEGWQLDADQVHLRLSEARWPENSFMLRYQSKTQSYFAFVKNLQLESILNTSITWPEKMKPILAVKPQGQLHDTQVQFTTQGIDSVLSRFSDLGWQPLDSQPGVTNLSGVLHWQPNQGQLELASDNAVITLKQQKPISLSVVDVVFDWQKLSDGLRLNIDRFVINHSNLLLSARAVVDKITEDSSGEINLRAEFSANEAQHLLPYIPGKHLKKKLDAWLKHDVKRIEELSGTLVVNGALADFPYDKQPGEFSINSHFKGLDLIFARNWSLSKDLEGNLRVNKRNLDMDIVHANLQGIIINKAKLGIDDIGLDKEVLLLRTQVAAKSDKALAYIMSSPLHKKLSALSMLRMQGLLDLHLQLEAPLYPQNDTILALGEIKFKNDKINVHHSMDDIELTQLSGSLQFNETGILSSNLKTKILECPTNLAIRSVHEQIPYTEVKLSGSAKAGVLNKKLNLPIFALLHGSLQMNSTLKFTDDPNDLDHLRVQTSLDGLAIDLPPPLGKPAEIKAPLTVDIDFNPEKAVRLRFNYDNRLSTDLWFSRPKKEFQLQKGEIRIGNVKAGKQNEQGLSIIGSLPSFDLQQWLDAKAKLPQVNEQSLLMKSLNRVDLRLQNAKIWREEYKELLINAAKLTGDNWAIQLNQANLMAKLRYKPDSNTLTGQIDKLRIETKADKSKEIKNSALKPTDIPNLDLHIASFQWGEVEVGDVSLKTRSTEKLWRLEHCKINTPSYVLAAKGTWKQDGKLNDTQLTADLTISDLAASLARWKISPAVEAKEGVIQFQGGWPGAIPDFQLAKVSGQVSMDFRNGRITNLSTETEEKLGLGKLLSILSLQTIPRRLKLDFSDLSHAGYSFDKFQGNFDIHNGIMTTQDSYIDGPVAYAGMKGNLDIAKQNYDVDLKISPHITASLPIVATIAGGPIVGFATWVASKIINQGMQKISGYTYKVTGPWKQPLVEQVSIIKKRKVPLRA
ncbi:putative protein involved in outer membrane biogenesis [Legionella massiliensis]|uniref:YhdP central domain-containing protein n=1 Tax=Legionella massiliensis TaxID=1034943 RepID=A0A078L021_9GAMM|nr:YhdP family protein [Legionella massiliensis]CDZ78607.1 putative protein involved in outer membrane biogenesis [Legionella massiliensis]CEE14345.1 hypothetical protein BN1094_02917 [Legionella massiliensis]